MKVLYETTLPSIIHNDEICAELVKISLRENFPVQKAKFSSKLEKYVGFGANYKIYADKLPAIPGGWKVSIVEFEPAEKHLLVNVTSKKNAQGEEAFEINRYVLQMFEEFRKEGLTIELTKDYEKVYGAFAQRILAEGHPILLDNLEEFVENMR